MVLLSNSQLLNNFPVPRFPPPGQGRRPRTQVSFLLGLAGVCDGRGETALQLQRSESPAPESMAVGVGLSTPLPTLGS